MSSVGVPKQCQRLEQWIQIRQGGVYAIKPPDWLQLHVHACACQYRMESQLQEHASVVKVTRWPFAASAVVTLCAWLRYAAPAAP
jgi:hypothetical protein